MATQLQTPPPVLIPEEQEERRDPHSVDHPSIEPGIPRPKRTLLSTMKSHRKSLFIAAVIVALVLSVASWIYFSSYESTDDAQVDAELDFGILPQPSHGSRSLWPGHHQAGGSHDTFLNGVKDCLVDRLGHPEIVGVHDEQTGVVRTGAVIDRRQLHRAEPPSAFCEPPSAVFRGRSRTSTASSGFRGSGLPRCVVRC